MNSLPVMGEREQREEKEKVVHVRMYAASNALRKECFVFTNTKI